MGMGAGSRGVLGDRGDPQGGKLGHGGVLKGDEGPSGARRGV